jgi:hypothetical protein
MKRKLLFAAMLIAGALGFNVNAQEDITSTYLTNADLSTVDNGWTYYSDAYKYQQWRIGDDSKSSAVEFYAGWGSLEHTNFKFSQTVTLPAGDYRIAVNALYREGNDGNGTNANKAWIFAGETKQNVYALNGMSAVSAYDGGGDDMDDAQRALKAGAFSNAFDFSLAEETEISLGFEGVFSTTRSWCILGPVKLYKYSLEDYLVDYRAKVAEAEALYTSPMNADVLAALKAAVVEESSFSLSSEVLAATATLTTKIADANNSISVYSSIKSAISNYATSAAALDDAGAAAYNASAIQTKYDNGTYETLAEAEVDLAAALSVATKAQTTEGSNWTGVIINPSFESDFSNGWNNTGSFARQGNDSFAKTGTYYAEIWQPNGTKTLTQTLTAMPAGVYRLTAHSKARGVTSAKIFAAGVNTPITVADSDADYSVEFACDANANVEIGFEGVGTGSANSWICVDNFTLTLVSAGLPDVTAAEGKMNADVAAAQTNAISSYNAGKTVAGYNAAKAAIAAAEASIAAYVPFTTAINKIDAAITAATTATASTDSYDAVKATYTNGSVADADIRTAIINAYNAVIPVIKSQTAASADFTLAIQNQSFEYGDLTGWTVVPSSDTGARETSNATFAAAGSDGQYLFNTWWKGNPITQAVTNLPNGQYTLTVSVASDGATIYLIANGGHNEGTETGGTYPSSDTFQEANFTFLVKDGSATIGAVGGADGTAGEHKDYYEEGYWWYKADNFRLVKNRELTEEEMAIVPTGVTLDKNEVTLTATETSVTLTPTFEPENATNTVTWASSDETVATVAKGVVTAVAPGTTTITVTSTLDENVKASCEVTVSFPESTMPAYFVNDGASRTVYTLGENLIKNGTFSYPNAVATWKTVGYTTDAVVSNFTITAEGGAVDNGAFITTNGGGVGSEKTIRKSVQVEVGKKYYFSVYTSGKAPSSDNLKYNALFKMSDAATETGTIKEFVWPQGADKTSSEWSKTECVFTAETPYVGVRMGWNESSNFDEFVLAEITEEATVGNVQYALDAIPTTNIGTGAFQYSQAAIDAANALVQGTATVEDVTNAYNAVTTLNAPAEGKLYNIVNITDGFAHKGKALTFKAASDADLSGNTTSMAWEAEPGYYMPQGVKFTAVENVKNGYKLSYTRADGNVVYISTGTLSGLGNNHNQIRPTNDATKALTFEVTSVGDNHWYLKNTETGNNVGSNGDTGFYTAGGSNKDMKIQEAVNNEVALNIKAENQYGTIILPFNADAPAGVTVYSVSKLSGNTLTLVEENTFEANTPYIVFAETGATATLEGLGSAYTDASYTEGLLTGVYAATAAPADSYVLQNNDNKVGFYLVKEGEQPTVGANRAYLTKPATGDVKAAYFFDNETAIQGVFDGLKHGDIYDIAGRKVSRMQKGGVYVVAGKKVVIK